MHVLVTAGPTREAIDPVRYISNHSSGMMGYAMAEAARNAGARVILLSGPVSLPAPDGIECVGIETADELFAATTRFVDASDIFIAAAAVADYRPKQAAEEKIKKKQASMSIDLVRSPDVLASVARRPSPPFTVGFAAETENLREHALAKLKTKGLDMIIANEVGDGRAFGRDENAAHVFWSDGDRAFPMDAKPALAHDLMQLIAERFAASLSAAAGEKRVAELPQRAQRD